MSGTKVVLLPHRLTPAWVSRFGCELHELGPADEFEFDFGQQRWFPPFSMVLLAMHLRRFRERYPETAFYAKNFDNHSYAAHMGFFKTFGLDHGNAPGEASGSSTHIPIQSIKRSELSEQASKAYVEIGYTIEDRAASLASLLTQTDNGVLHDTLTYSIREIIRNVFEHSEAGEVFLCAQHWPSRHEVGNRRPRRPRREP